MQVFIQHYLRLLLTGKHKLTAVAATQIELDLKALGVWCQSRCPLASAEDEPACSDEISAVLMVQELITADASQFGSRRGFG